MFVSVNVFSFLLSVSYYPVYVWLVNECQWTKLQNFKGLSFSLFWV